MTHIHKRILSGAALFSLTLHALALVLLQSYSLWFNVPSVRPQMVSLDKQSHDQILKESFAPPVKSKEGGPVRNQPKQEPTPNLAHKAPTPHEAPPVYSLFTPQSLLASNDILPHPFSLPKQPTINLFEHLPQDLYIPQALTVNRSIHLPTPIAPEFQLSSPPNIPLEVPEQEIAQREPLVQIPSFSDKVALVKPPAPTMAPFPKLPTLSELQTTNASDSFDAEISFLPVEQGYVFAITLIPKSDLELPKLKQHYTFLIDRSNSIQKERLQAVKIGVLRALEELNDEDTFNLFVFDSKAEKMAPSSLTANPVALAQADGFLARMELGSFFSTANLDRPLMLTVPGKVQDDEVYTAILLTDGETLSKKGEQYALLSNWSAYNQGKVALFPVSMAGDAHLATLELAAKSNKGKLVCAPTHRGFKRKLLKLMRSLHAPIAKSIACRGVSGSKGQILELYPKPFQAPHLYLDQPYTLIGRTDRLDDFVLFLQGRLKNGWLNIKKKISFAKARKGGKSLKAEWALQSAHNLYEEFLHDQNPAHIAEARELLAPYDYQIAFE